MIMELGEPCPFANGGRGTGRCVILLSAALAAAWSCSCPGRSARRRRGLPRRPRPQRQRSRALPPAEPVRHD